MGLVALTMADARVLRAGREAIGMKEGEDNV